MVDQPDFENMTPDEIMAWMETLAKRQGATEGFTTDADLDIPEIDPDTAVIDEPGYVPYSESRASSPSDDTVVSRPISPTQPARPPAPPPDIPAPPPARPAAPPPAMRPVTPAWSAPPRSTAPPPVQPPPKPAPEPQGSLAWLENLAQQNDDNLFNLDLSGLGEDASEPAESDPAAWLQAMAATPDLEQIAAGVPEPQDDTESLRWLESLARRQGAPADELTTSADLDVGAVRGEPEAPAYTPFSFNTAPAPRTATRAANPADFLGSLAASEGYSEAGVMATREPEPAQSSDDEDIEEIKRAISEGRVTADQISTFFEYQADIAETRPPGPDELGLEEEDDLPVPADLPDWLLEQVQVDQPPAPAGPPPGVPSLESLFEQPEPDIPDWLREDSAGDVDDLKGIFASVEPSDEIEIESMVVDVSDPWVEALELEHTEGMAPVDSPPPWYLRNLSDPARVAAVESVEPALSSEPLPSETVLPAGEPQSVPGWMAAAPAAASDDIPEWLHEMENAVASSEIPAWLNEPVEASALGGLPFELEDAPATPEFIIDAPAAPPEPEPAPAAAATLVPALASARDRRQAGDVAGALAEYEALIRSNSSLQECVDDLAHVARLERGNPVVFRVLGDGYMRLGKLQLALDTYREALNHL